MWTENETTYLLPVVHKCPLSAPLRPAPIPAGEGEARAAEGGGTAEQICLRDVQSDLQGSPGMGG